jgi:hypothetical protein
MNDGYEIYYIVHNNHVYSFGNDSVTLLEHDAKTVMAKIQKDVDTYNNRRLGFSAHAGIICTEVIDRSLKNQVCSFLLIMSADCSNEMEINLQKKLEDDFLRATTQIRDIFSHYISKNPNIQKMQTIGKTNLNQSIFFNKSSKIVNWFWIEFGILGTIRYNNIEGIITFGGNGKENVSSHDKLAPSIINDFNKIFADEISALSKNIKKSNCLIF